MAMEAAGASVVAAEVTELALFDAAGLGLFDAVSGVCGAVCCTYAGLPFDVAKVRLQSQAAPAAPLPPVATASASSRPVAYAPRYCGLVDCVLSTIREDGYRGLFRGAAPALASACAENAVGITVQHAAHRRLALYYGDPETRFSMTTECMLGGFTGIFTSVAMCPFEVAKVQLQVAGATPNAGKAQSMELKGCVRAILRDHGVRGFFRGLTGLWARDIPFNAVFFGSYETFCTALMKYSQVHSKDDLSPAQVLCSGGCAGALGWSLVLPFDVAKTRLQSGQIEGSCFRVLRHIARTEGMKGLFSGWGPAVMRAFPANAGLFLGVETSNRWIHRTFGN
mmetsp:Transcript_62121/g.160168  ORF Transcript_62121/g.160168 Transcript_62121/m.160168 type:complete len:338 (-) Transcript_62121:339-1352(-)